MTKTKKVLIFLLFTFFSTYLQAGLIDALAIKVNNQAITLYDIDMMMQKHHSTKKQAIDTLIDKTLYKQELKKYNIHTGDFEINRYLSELAKRNGVDLATFKSIVRQRYKSLSAFKTKLKLEINKKTLMSKIIKGNITPASTEDMKIYYHNNLSHFRLASKYRVIQYFSRSKADLEALRRNPLLQNRNVIAKPVSLNRKNLNSQIKYILENTKVDNFTNIFPANKQFLMLLMKSKTGLKKISFKEAKPKIFSILMKQREQKFLRDYSQKLRLKADIEFIR